MKINKREVMLISLLIILIFVYFNIRLLSATQAEKTKILEQISAMETNTLLIETDISTKDKITNENLEIIKEIENSTQLIINDVKQEEIIVLLEQLNDTNNFKILNIDFSEMIPTNFSGYAPEEDIEMPDVVDTMEEAAPSEQEPGQGNIIEETPEALNSTTADGLIEQHLSEYNVDIDFASDYESIVDYVKRINDMKKYIYVTKIDISPDIFNTDVENITTEEIIASKSQLKGKMSICIGTINGLEEYGLTNKGLDVSFGGATAGIENPFIPYNEYIAKIVEENKVEIIEEIPIINEEMPTIDVDIAPEVSAYVNYTNVTDFERNDFFFVSDPVDVAGETILNSKATSGLWSAQLSHNFINGTEENIVNLVFDKEMLVLEKQVEKLSMDVYSEQYSYHTVGMVIMDSAGKEHEITFSDGVYWTNWNTLEANVSNTITYPAVISRIYVKDNGEKSNLNGSYLFDKLQVLYSDDVARSE
ncbi:MAG: hypothetical protein ACK5LT_12230 [Lachnospirales bacterium]